MACAGALTRSALLNMRGLVPAAWVTERNLRIRSCLSTEPPLHPRCSLYMGPWLASARHPRAAPAASAKRSCWTGGARRTGVLNGGRWCSSLRTPPTPRAQTSGCSEIDKHFMLLALEQARKVSDDWRCWLTLLLRQICRHKPRGISLDLALLSPRPLVGRHRLATRARFPWALCWSALAAC